MLGGRSEQSRAGKGKKRMASEKQEPGKRYPYRGQSKRLKGYDYTQPGPYFVTITARKPDPIFEHPQLRAILHETWQALPQQFPGVKLDAFVRMPNHIHGMLWLPGQGQPAPTLSRVMGAYKSLTTVAWIRACKTIGIQGFGTFWLDDFYDRIIPNTAALQRIRHYIRQNPTALATREWEPPLGEVASPSPAATVRARVAGGAR